MKLLILALTILTISAHAQLVNRLQNDPKRIAFIKAFEEKKMVKIMGGKYKVEDINYFFINHKKQSADGLYTEYKWALKDGFVVGKDSVNLNEVQVKNLTSGKTITLRYITALGYEVKFLKRRVRR